MVARLAPHRIRHGYGVGAGLLLRRIERRRLLDLRRHTDAEHSGKRLDGRRVRFVPAWPAGDLRATGIHTRANEREPVPLLVSGRLENPPAVHIEPRATLGADAATHQRAGAAAGAGAGHAFENCAERSHRT